MLDGKTVLITGGTGSFGKTCTKMIFEKFKPQKLIVFSRDEFKQYEMSKLFPERRFPTIRFFLGDVRDRDRLHRAFEGVDYVIHAAALKQVPALEYNPSEAIKTNILGADNVIAAAVDCGVRKVIAISTDKAVNPINLYGATKLAAEKLFVAANAFSGGKVKFAVVRYGNVIGSRGSVIPSFLKLKEEGILDFPVTDKRMTRFLISLEQGVNLVLKALELAEGGEVFVPCIPSMKIVDLAKAIQPRCVLRFSGIRPGEKLHETLISEDEARKTKKLGGFFVILPQFFENERVHKKYSRYPSLPEGFSYRSDTNDSWVTGRQLNALIKESPLE